MKEPKFFDPKVIQVDLKIAKEFLAKERPPEPGVEGTNRKPGVNVIIDYATDMALGRWVLSHQGIAFNSRDEMVDGGHRMRAFIMAAEEGIPARDGADAIPANPGLKIWTLATFNVPDEAQMVMDLGKRRVPSDFLTMKGKVNVTTLSGAIRLGLCYETVPWAGYDNWRRFRITPTMQAEYLQKNPGLADSVYESFSLKKVLKSSTATAFCYLAERDAPDVPLQEFLEPLRTGRSIDEGDPVLTLRELMLGKKKNKYSAAQELALTIKAFNRWAQGGTYLTGGLHFRKDEPFPKL